MTQWVSKQNSMSAQTWRRHTDPPGLWIAIITGSVALHLLLFWMMRSYGFNLSQQKSSSAVPIEFMEIGSKTRAKARPQAKVKSLTAKHSQPTIRKSVSAVLPKHISPEKFTVKPTLEDSNTIAFANNKKVSKSQTEELSLPEKFLKTPIVKQKIALAKPKATKQLVATLPSPNIDTIKPTHTHRSHTPKHNNPQPKFSPNITPEEQTQLPDEQNQSLPPFPNTTNSTETTPSRELPQLATEPQNPPVKNGEAIAQAPTNQLGETPRTEKPPTPQGGLLVATWNVEADGVQKDRPENLAKPIGSSREKDINLPSFDGLFNSQSVEFQASLIIDSNGNLLDVMVSPQVPEPQRSKYREYTQKVFQGQKFIPATSSNGNKPPLSNLVVKITLQAKPR
jgi:hypothetical protein